VDMIEKLFGGKSAEEVLLYFYAFDEGYASEIASFSGFSLNVIQKQLQKFEDSGLLVSKKIDKTRVFFWNPRYYFLDEFKAFIKKVFMSLPENELKKYYEVRKRPRKGDKKL
jgi:hypothetical protein